MKHNTHWRSMAVGMLAACLAITQLELQAFAQSNATGAVAASGPAGAIPGGATAPAQEPAPAPPKKKSRMKWILVAAGAAGAAIAVGMSKKKESSTPGTITIGPPTIGQP